ISEMIIETNVDAVCVASILHYDTIINNHIKFEEADEGNYDFLKKGEGAKRIKGEDIVSIKKSLKNKNILIRA
ncbi:MAG: hypothetical protein K2X86_18910, partial [Cytophagaceae bacterium]|nr:hypothetical protein [Cytophagaceae bacterium]